MPIIHSESDDIFLNLATESFILDNLTDPPYLFLWVCHPPAIILGRHQCVEYECSPQILEKDGIILARRISGGGTVYHDKGNLNYSLFFNRQEYNDTNAYALIIELLGELGIDSFLKNKSNIYVKDGKVSGTAFRFTKNYVMHHGTLLVDADLNKLKHLLTPKYPKNSKAVKSKTAKVVNLTSIIPEINIQKVEDMIGAIYSRKFHDNESLILSQTNKQILGYAEMLKADSWIYRK